MASSLARYTLVFYAPPAAFRPGDAANPHIGTVGALEETPEVRVETLCVGTDVARKAVEALKSAHPYEEPAYQVYKMEDM
ncbi:hypothetical protein ACCO45_010567 [Purpureocillium lilacinum]|uniref:Uncharacterized protein n=1 Tax=Purpureocillium lilacinum TaxID=33203 RepID=A0ACC4DHH3_PURLI